MLSSFEQLWDDDAGNHATAHDARPPVHDNADDHYYTTTTTAAAERQRLFASGDGKCRRASTGTAAAALRQRRRQVSKGVYWDGGSMMHVFIARRPLIAIKKNNYFDINDVFYWATTAAAE